jgi:hypothetical protein
MGFGIVLMNEFGGKIEETADFLGTLPGLLPPVDDPAYPFLGSIDPYGSTIFNRVQMNRFLLEWEYVASHAQLPQEHELVATTRRMANRCLNEVHLYLKFVGD